MRDKPALSVYLAEPRGFCAGVDRAIDIIDRALQKYGAPVYVRHEIVHNAFVVNGLKAKGAVFVDELSEVPDGVPVVFSAHGVAKSVPAEADARALHYIDATCPLVSKVHREADRHFAAGYHVVLIGHAGHPEVIGTMGQLPEGAITLGETEQDAGTVTLPDAGQCAYVTQTTLSVDDTSKIVDILKRRFPKIVAPAKEDICYATTNRQAAVKEIAAKADLVLVLGAPNSSNSNRLKEVAERFGARKSVLLGRASDIDWSWFKGVETLGVTAGASAPEILVKEVLEACRTRFEITLFPVTVATENVTFKLPRELA